MKKRIFGAAIAATAAVFALASCGETPAATTTATPTGDTPAPTAEPTSNVDDQFLILCWNDEFRAFFNKYLSDEGVAALAAGTDLANPKAKDGLHYKGVEAVWRETPSDGGAYQTTLDMMLENQSKAKDKVDMFLAEADYIQKYADSDLTADITTLGGTIDQSNIYAYTKQAATSTKDNKVKGVSFQCCPAGLIYNTVIAQEVLGSADPAEVQKAVASWTKFDETAAAMKAAGYYMTACCDETYRVFSNNASEPWVNADDELAIPKEVEDWIDQAAHYVDEAYTVVGGVWSGEKTANINANEDGSTEKAFCCFGPAWYYNFCMGGTRDGGIWKLVAGPQGWFWGGTWIMAPAGANNADLTASVMNAVLNDETFLTKLTKVEGQFVNNKATNNANAADATFKNTKLDQNDAAIWVQMADSIVWANHTVYDQLCNEGVTSAMADYFNGEASKDDAIASFLDSIVETYPNLTVAE